MANRHLSRSVVLQSLHEADFNNTTKKKASAILERNADEFAPGRSDFSYMEAIFDGILTKQKDLDKIIEDAAPQWPVEKISVVDRNILRIGLFELLFGDANEVPPKVAINEAIELAKTFGGETSSKFVNGVLGAVYKELGEPDKDAQPRKKGDSKHDIPDEEAPIKNLVGAVVYAKKGEEIYLALVHDVFGHWTLSKGKLEKDEDLEIGVVRKVKEEIGLDIKITNRLGQNEYIAHDPEEGKLRKQVTYFLAEAPFADLKLAETGGLDDAKWFKLSDILDLNFYDDILPIVTDAIKTLLEKEDDFKNKN